MMTYTEFMVTTDMTKKVYDLMTFFLFSVSQHCLCQFRYPVKDLSQLTAHHHLHQHQILLDVTAPLLVHILTAFSLIGLVLLLVSSNLYQTTMREMEHLTTTQMLI